MNNELTVAHSRGKVLTPAEYAARRAAIAEAKRKLELFERETEDGHQNFELQRQELERIAAQGRMAQW